MRPHQALSLRAKAARSPERTVTRDEFLKLARAAGWTDDQADRACQTARILGRAVLVGEEMLGVDVIYGPLPLWEGKERT